MIYRARDGRKGEKTAEKSPMTEADDKHMNEKEDERYVFFKVVNINKKKDVKIIF